MYVCYLQSVRFPTGFLFLHDESDKLVVIFVK
jgi:hypothetical protein